MQSTEDHVNKLLELDELRSSDRKYAIARVASIIGHLVGTPLNVIAGRAALIRVNAQDPLAIVDDVARIERQVEQLTTRLRALIEFLSTPDAPIAEGSVAQLLDDALQLYGPIALARGSELKLGACPAGDAHVDRSVLYGLVTCLVSLATQRASAGSIITLDVERAATGPSQRPYGYVCIALAARGLGSRAPQKLDRISFTEAIPSHAVEEQQLLSVCSALSDRAGGRLDLASTDEGSRILLTWPCSG
jgi:signal transduction histidine kinase